jgi:hypothetical protein
MIPTTPALSPARKSWNRGVTPVLTYAQASARVRTAPGTMNPE